MKTPLRYQITEFDCGTVSLINCITYLFDRENIPAELIKNINVYTLDCYDEHGNLGPGGTSRQAVEFISQWISKFCKIKQLDLECKYLSGKQVTLDIILDCLKRGGCVNLRTYQTQEHYVMISGFDHDNILIFDPYYMQENEYINDDDVSVVEGFPTQFNRKVSKKRFVSEEKLDFALGPIESRECVIMYRT